MIIEDELRLGNLTAQLLQQSGYNTVVETDGKRGLQKIKKENPDVILTDVMLPGLTGLEICKSLKHNQDLKHIPVIAITGRTDLDSQKAALKAGADYFLAKPYDLQFLLKIINSVNKSKSAKKSKLSFLNLKFLNTLLLSLGILSSTGFASPWVTLPGHAYHELQYGNYEGAQQSFQKQQVQYYLEYGLVPPISVLGNILSGTVNTQSFTQGEAGLNFQILKSDWNRVSVQQWVSNVSGVAETETRLAVGGNFEKLPLFWSVEPGVHGTQTVFRSVLGFKAKPFEIIGQYDQSSIAYQQQQYSLKFIWSFPENIAMALRLTSGSSSGAALGVIKTL